MNRTQSWLVIWRALVGTGTLAWELGVDGLHHWPLLVLVCWLLGAPLEALVQFFTDGRLQIRVRKGRDEDEGE